MLHFFLVLVLLAASIQPSFACSRDPSQPEPTDEDFFRQASAVFLGRIYKTEESTETFDGRVEPMVIGTFRLIEVFKGQPPTDNTVRDPIPGPGNCGLMLQAGVDYLFFLHSEMRNYVPWPNGSRGFFNTNARDAKQLFDKLRALK
ncbi:MAG: hypothetical protein KBC46_09205 [Ferrovibrio sp.]|nr:hypothetical protein [Ferrovibrio sp.]